MNDDVLDHIIKWCKWEMEMCQSGLLIHDGEKDDAIKTYQADAIPTGMSSIRYRLGT